MLRNMPYRIGYCLSLAISLAPFSRLRVALYRLLRGYDIAWSARIGFGTVIDAEQVAIGRAAIGRFNFFRGPFALIIRDGARIGHRNCVECGRWVLESRFESQGYPRRCCFGANVYVTGGHHIDAVGGFELGDDSWIAGRDSQFWTHGVGAVDRSITIGRDNYIGSAVRFIPGTAVAHHSIVGIGSVVTKKFTGDYLMIAGVPARVIKENYYYKDHDPMTAAMPD
jgi:serine acetyltransferase